VALTLDQIKVQFGVFGKIVFISNLAAPDIEAYQKAAMGTIAQSISGAASEYPIAQEVLVPLLNNIKGTVTSLSQVPTNAKVVLDSYLKRVLAPAMGVSSSLTAKAVVEELIDQMENVNATVAPSGDEGANDDGFAMFFYNNYAVELPQDPSPDILDAWIDDDVTDPLD